MNVTPALAIAAAAALLGACGGETGSASSPPRVFAAASLRETFPRIDGAPTYNFAGSNQLQLQVERGAPADVFASASPEEAQALFRAGRCDRPRPFATNVLVLLVPRSNPGRVRSVESLRAGRRRLAVGVAGVPIGAYTRRVLGRLGLSSILRANRVSSEPNVASIVSKVALGSADAGFAYVTDARAAGDRVRAIRLPAAAQPSVRYEICAVRRDGANEDGARAFIDAVTSSRGRRVLRGAGFGVPAADSPRSEPAPGG